MRFWPFNASIFPLSHLTSKNLLDINFVFAHTAHGTCVMICFQIFCVWSSDILLPRWRQILFVPLAHSIAGQQRTPPSPF